MPEKQPPQELLANLHATLSHVVGDFALRTYSEAPRHDNGYNLVLPHGFSVSTYHTDIHVEAPRDDMTTRKQQHMRALFVEGRGVLEITHPETPDMLLYNVDHLPENHTSTIIGMAIRPPENARQFVLQHAAEIPKHTIHALAVATAVQAEKFRIDIWRAGRRSV